MPPDDIALYDEMTAPKSPVERSHVIRWIHKDGRVIWTESRNSVIRDEAGRAVAVMGIARDITERKMAEKALQASEEKFRNLVENFPVGIGITALDGRPILRNIAQARILGYDSAEELFSFPVITRYYNPEDRKRFIEQAGKGMVKDFEVQMKRKDGSPVWCSLTAIPQTNEEGEQQFITVTQDISERKQAEDILRSSREEMRNLAMHIESVREEERTLIAREIHDEFGQTLTALQMDMFWLKGQIPGNRRQVIAKIDEMLGLVDATADRVREISYELRPGILDDFGLEAALEWAVNNFAERTKIKCDVTVEPENVTLDKDLTTVIYRILVESLNNIARHAGATGVKVSLRVNSEQAAFHIEDNGRGITPDEVRDHRSFGLLGMKERVTYRGGKIDIRGVPGEGTFIDITLPLRKGESNAADSNR